MKNLSRIIPLFLLLFVLLLLPTAVLGEQGTVPDVQGATPEMEVSLTADPDSLVSQVFLNTLNRAMAEGSAEEGI